MKIYSLVLLLLAISCGDDRVKKVEILEDFRILAAVTNKPEVSPGETANLQLFISDVKGGGRVITGTTVACIDPGISFGAKVNCDHDPSAQSDTYTIDTNALDVPNGLYTGLATDTLNVTVPLNIFTGRGSRDQFNGVGFIVIFNFTVDGRNISTFKRITATNRGTFNSNPAGSTILLNGSSIGSAPEDGDDLEATSSAPEFFDYQTIDGVTENREEKLAVAWYITQGELTKPKSNVGESTSYKGKKSTASSAVIAIIRDERGGVDIVSKIFP
jgi:hypothetical protein